MKCPACENGGGYHSRDCRSDEDCTCGMNDCRACMKRPGARSPYPVLPRLTFSE